MTTNRNKISGEKLRGEHSKKMQKGKKGPPKMGDMSKSMEMQGSDRNKIVDMANKQARMEDLRGKWS